MFNNVYKKDFIEVTVMKARQKMRKMRINPYPDAIIRYGLHKKEAQETTEPVLEEAIMYTAVVGMELMEGLAMTSDTVDRMVLETSERKVEVDGALVRLRHQLSARDDRIAIFNEWKGEVTKHMRDIGEAQALGARGGVLGGNTANTLQGNGQSTCPIPTQYTTITFRILPPNFLAVPQCRKWPVHLQCSQRCDCSVLIM